MDSDVLKDIPGYRAILKSVLKIQIQLLVEQLCEQAGEESIILTASLSDGSLSHLGSKMGKGFFEEREEIKSQFLGYCLKSQHGGDTTHANVPLQRDQSLNLFEHDPPAVKKQRFQPGIAPSIGQRFENQSLQNFDDKTIQSFPSSSLNSNRRKKVPRKQPIQLPVQTSKYSVSIPVYDIAFKPVIDRDIGSNIVAVKVETDDKIPNAVQNVGTDSEDTSEYSNITSEYSNITSVNDDHGSGNDEYSRDTNISVVDQPGDTKMEPNIKIEPPTENEDIEITGIEMAGGGSRVPGDWAPDVAGMLGDQSAVSGADVLNQSGNPYSSHANSSDSKFECQECGKVLSKKFSLERHMLIHKDPELSCSFCHKKFRFQRSLDHHVASRHTGDGKHVCLVCDARFPCAFNLRRHQEVVHLRMKNYQCDICGLDFARKESFQSHVLSHEGLKPFQCQTCKKSFKLKRSMATHSCQKALRPVPTCSTCGKVFKKRKFLIQHEQIHLEPSRQCFKCGQLFIWQASLHKHLKTCNKRNVIEKNFFKPE